MQQAAGNEKKQAATATEQKSTVSTSYWPFVKKKAIIMKVMQRARLVLLVQ